MRGRVRTRHTLAARMAVSFALLSFAVIAAVGYGLYSRLERQLILRDDAALVTRVDQLRTLLRDADIIDLISGKPQLFANMLGNREALLVLKFRGEAPLIEVNPGNTPIPDLVPVGADRPLALSAVQHTAASDSTPFISVAAEANTSDPQRQLIIIAGRLMTERTKLLRGYRHQIIFLASCAALLTALVAYVLARRGLGSLAQLARKTESIGVHNLAVRFDKAEVPGELLVLIDGFNGMLDRLEGGFLQLSRVSADMAHDLRTPIGIMLGEIEVGLGQVRDQDYYERLLGSTFEELQRLSSMINNMLFLARAEHASHAIDRRALDIRDEFLRVREYFEGPADERHIGFEFGNTAGVVWADPTLLRRALANVLANAVRHADAGSLITLAAQAGTDGTCLTVVNKGPTIAPEHLAHLFDRFYRVDESRGGSVDSHGLGLSIVRSIMSLHQGAWKAESAEGTTRFTLIFPHQKEMTVL